MNEQKKTKLWKEPDAHNQKYHTLLPVSYRLLSSALCSRHSPSHNHSSIQLKQSQEESLACCSVPALDTSAMADLIPGLPEEVARECLVRVAFEFLHRGRSACTCSAAGTWWRATEARRGRGAGGRAHRGHRLRSPRRPRRGSRLRVPRRRPDRVRAPRGGREGRVVGARARAGGVLRACAGLLLP
jgi:hypothetical protein